MVHLKMDSSEHQTNNVSHTGPGSQEDSPSDHNRFWSQPPIQVTSTELATNNGPDQSIPTSMGSPKTARQSNQDHDQQQLQQVHYDRQNQPIRPAYQTQHQVQSNSPRRVEVASNLDGQTEESSQAQLSSTQVLHQPPQGLEPQTLTRRDVKAKGACYYCKEEGHLIRSCPKKRLHRLEKKILKQDPTDGQSS